MISFRYTATFTITCEACGAQAQQEGMVYAGTKPLQPCVPKNWVAAGSALFCERHIVTVRDADEGAPGGSTVILPGGHLYAVPDDTHYIVGG